MQILVHEKSVVKNDRVTMDLLLIALDANRLTQIYEICLDNTVWDNAAGHDVMYCVCGNHFKCLCYHFMCL